MPEALSKEEAIFHAALAIDGTDQRSAYLDAACLNQHELRRRVEALLRRYTEAQGPLDRPVLSPVVTTDEPISERPGTIIGPYKLMEQIGEGGFGLVFIADQQRPVRRRVALKVIKPGMDTRAVIARFEAERQALAIMDHPNIAKVHDGGETVSGRPYFVMELVKGVPITEYSDDNRLTPRERLELFLHVCQAVQHAHQKGIIHRDIKPSNVLVVSHDGTPVVKVIDFGVAKAIGQQLTDKTLYTQSAQLVGTPLYMSPEQAGQSGLDIDTRTDIYALGVLLYELLTGTTPFAKERFQEAGYDEIRRIIREEEPPKPSTRISTLGQAATTASTQRKSDPKRLSQLFRGELDWIVMKCLEKDRNRRYETANGLAHDIERYLHDEPVQACPPSAWYRFRKFARRKKTALAVAACVFMTLAGIAGGIGWAVRDKGAREEGIERDRLAREQALDEAVDTTLNETGLLMDQGKWSEALDAVERADKLLAAAGRTERPPRLLELRKDLIMAERLEAIYRGPTVRLRTRFVGSSEYGSEYTFQAQPDSFAEESFWGRQQDDQFGRAFQDYGIDVDQLAPVETAAQIAQRSIRSALVKALDEWALLRTRARPDGLNDPGWKKLVEIARQADPDPWRNRCRESLLRRDRQGLEQLADAVPIRQVQPATLYLLGHTLKEVGAVDKAMDLLSRAQHEYPDDVWVNDALAFFSWSACQPPRYDDALRFYAAVLALRPRFAFTHISVADTLKAKGAVQEAVVEYSRAIELDPKNVETWIHRGWAYSNLRQYDKAVTDFSKAIEVDPKNAWPWHERGLTYRETRQYDKALADLTKAIELDPKHVVSLFHRGGTYGSLHQYDKALADCSKAIEMEPKNGWAWHERVWIYIHMGQYDKALTDANKAIALNVKGAGFWRGRAAAYGELGQYQEAVADLSKAIELDPKSADFWSARGSTYRSLHQYEKALADFSKAIELDPNNPWTWAERDRTYGELREHDNKSLAEARLHVRLSQWDEAAATYTRVNWSGRLHDDAFEYACLFLVRGDKVGYDKFCRQMIQQAGQTKDPFELYVLARTCAMTAQAVVDPAQSVQWAKQAVAGDRAPWFVHALALAQYRAGQFDAALKSLNEALVGRWNFPDYCWLGLALVHQRMGHAAEARQCLEKGTRWLDQATSPNPQTPVMLRPEVWLESRLVLRELEPMVIADCSKGIDQDPKDAERWNTRGSVYLCLRQYDKAIDDFTKAIQLAPKEALPWLNRGRVHARLGQWERAVADFSKAIELKPEEVQYLYQRGTAYFNLQQYDKAVADFTKVIALKPDFADAGNDRGAAYSRLKQNEKAIADYSQAIKLKPDFALALHNRAQLYAAQGQWDKALADFAKLVEIVPNNAVGQNNLAWFLATCPEPKLRDPAKAVQLAKKAVDLAPKEGNHWNTLGVAQYRAGDWKAAIEALTKSKELLGDTELSFNAFFLAMAQWQLGNKPEAHKWYERAVAWMEKNKPQDEELRRFRAEAEELLGIEKPTKPEPETGPGAERGGPRLTQPWHPL